MKRLQILLVLVAAAIATGCARVEVTKTAKGALTPSNPNEVEVLMTRPDRRYEELGTLTAHGYSSNDTAKMHNALRNGAAPLGANAVVITDSGQIPTGWGQYEIWANAVAVKWSEAVRALDPQQGGR